MRLFISINLNDDMIEALEDIQGSLKLSGIRGNYTRRENMHLTLAFIGEYPDPEDVMDALGNVSFYPFDISLSGYGNFGDLWWAGTDASSPLEAVARRVRRALSDAGIPFDKKKFRPHITILRRAELSGRMPSLKVPSAKMRVEKISLMRSDRGKNGMIYTEIGFIESSDRNG